MSTSQDDFKELSDDMEDGDEDFYYEVEEIIQMHVTESGVRMFEIKWKNYDSSYNNTWEPEHNLNCPTILKEFLEKNGYAQKGEKRKKKKKEKLIKSKQTDDVEFFKDSDVEINGESSGSKPDKSKTKKRKINEERDEALQKLLDKKKEKEKKAGAKKQKQKVEDNIKDVTRDLDEARASKLQNNQLAELKKPEEPKKKVGDTNDGFKKTAEDLAKQSEAKKKEMEIIKKKMEKPNKTPLPGIDKFKSKPFTTAPKQLTNEESFTSLKRDANPKPAQAFEIQDLLVSMQNTNRSVPSTGYAKPPNSTTSRYRLQPYVEYERNDKPVPTTTSSPTVPKQVVPTTTSSPTLPKQAVPATTSSPSLPKQLVPVTTSSPTLTKQPLLPSQPSPSSPKLPSLPPPSTPSPSPPHIPQHSAMKNPPVIPTKTPFEWQINDPRVRQRMLANSQTTNFPATNTQPGVRPSPTQYDLNPIKRQLSNPKDPRMKPDNMKKLVASNATAFPTPFEMDVALYNGSKFVATIKMEGKQTCYHEVQIKALLTAVSKSKNEMRITNTIPLKSLDAVLKDKAISYMSITPKDHIVDVSKLKSYYQVNEMAGVLHHPHLPQAIVVLAEADLKKLSNVDKDLLDLTPYAPLTLMFIDHLMPRPKFLDNDIQYELESKDNLNPYAWQRVTKYLRFPDQLTKLSSRAKFLVYGHSDTAAMLTKACNLLKPVQQQQPSYVMMFDRYNETMLSRNLTKHKKEPSTQIWEFGVPNFSVGKMAPAKQIFPNNTGGFVTTDMKNILHNPEILTIISTQVAKFNSMPSLYGEWKFILPHNWLIQTKKLITDTETARRAREAIISIVIALSSDSLSILKLWCTETEEPTCSQYLNRVAHEKYTTHQYFVYIDDISSVPTEERLHSIDFVQSSKFFSTFG